MRNMTSEEIEKGATKKRKESGDICKSAASRKRKREGASRGGEARKAAALVRAQDDSHSHVCILPECGMFCSPKFKAGNGLRQEKDTVCLRHGCQVTKTCVSGFGEHMCRSCHQTGTQCKTAICTYTACSRPQTFCEYLYAQEDAMKTSATEAVAVQVSVLFP